MHYAPCAIIVKASYDVNHNGVVNSWSSIWHEEKGIWGRSGEEWKVNRELSDGESVKHGNGRNL